MTALCSRSSFRRRKPSFRLPIAICGALALLCTTLTAQPRRGADGNPSAPLQGPAGITALSGQIVDLDGNGLPGVELSVGSSRTLSDRGGRFLLLYVTPGTLVLEIDGRRAGAQRDRDHGYYEAHVEARAGQTTVLPFKSWLPQIDLANEVRLPTPTRSEVVVRTPAIPGFELRIPPGVVIRDADGKIVDRIGITAVPPDRTPIPLPQNFDIPVFFTIQPGAACIYNAMGGPGRAIVIFPNFARELPKAKVALWSYAPGSLGWVTYGTGTVSADGRQVIPDRNAGISNFSSSECDPNVRTRKPPPERVEPEQSPGGRP